MVMLLKCNVPSIVLEDLFLLLIKFPAVRGCLTILIFNNFSRKMPFCLGLMCVYYLHHP